MRRTGGAAFAASVLVGLWLLRRRQTVYEIDLEALDDEFADECGEWCGWCDHVAPSGRRSTVRR